MPLFECDNCHCVDNSALTNFWMTRLKNNTKPQLCSECDPEIGKWHGQFSKTSATDSRFKRGDIEYPSSAKPNPAGA